jgi:hypothetical protein
MTAVPGESTAACAFHPIKSLLLSLAIRLFERWDSFETLKRPAPTK